MSPADIPAVELVRTLTPAELVADGVLSVKDACRFAAIGRTDLYDLMRAGLPYVQRGARRVIPVRALREVLAAGLVVPL